MRVCLSHFGIANAMVSSGHFADTLKLNLNYSCGLKDEEKRLHPL